MTVEGDWEGGGYFEYYHCYSVCVMQPLAIKFGIVLWQPINIQDVLLHILFV